MASKHDRARDLAEQGLDRADSGDKDKGRQLIDEAKKLDPKAVEEVAEEVERDKNKAEQFVGEK